MAVVGKYGKLRYLLRTQRVRDAAWGYLFIFPLVLGMAIFFIGPILVSFSLSFTNWSTLTEPDFVGLKNYAKILTDSRLQREILNTFHFTLGMVPASLFLSILLANALNGDIRGKSVFRTLYFLPVVTMPVAVALVWQWLFNSRTGLVNSFLRLLAVEGPIWLGDPNWIMQAIIIVSVWSIIGYNMIILLAGLQNIPETLYEAAEMDGASDGRKFWSITIPLLTPTIFFLLCISLINAFKAFDIIYIFAGAANPTQGPLLEATRTMVYGIYEKGFTFFEMGYASAEAVVLFCFILGVTILQFVVQKKWVQY